MATKAKKITEMVRPKEPKAPEKAENIVLYLGECFVIARSFDYGKYDDFQPLTTRAAYQESQQQGTPWFAHSTHKHIGIVQTRNHDFYDYEYPEDTEPGEAGDFVLVATGEALSEYLRKYDERNDNRKFYDIPGHTYVPTEEGFFWAKAPQIHHEYDYRTLPLTSEVVDTGFHSWREYLAKQHQLPAQNIHCRYDSIYGFDNWDLTILAVHLRYIGPEIDDIFQMRTHMYLEEIVEYECKLAKYQEWYEAEGKSLEEERLAKKKAEIAKKQKALDEQIKKLEAKKRALLE